MKSQYEQYEQEVLAWIDGTADLNLTKSSYIRVIHIDAMRRLIDKGIIRAVHMHNRSGVTKYERIK